MAASDLWQTELDKVLDEAELYTIFDKVRFALDRIDPWHPARFRHNGFPEKAFQAVCAECSGHCEQLQLALEKSRGTQFETLDGLFLFQSRFRTLMGRAHGLIEKFKAAYATLDQAESGLRPEVYEHRSQLALIHRARANVRILNADRELRRRWRIDSKAPIAEDRPTYARTALRRCAAARDRLGAADDELSQSEAMLRTASRNVRNWRELFESRVQLQIELLLLLAAEWEFGTAGEREELQLVARVHRIAGDGLAAVRAALDCTRVQKDAFLARRLAARWTQLLVGTFLLLRVIPHVQQTAEPRHRDISPTLRHLYLTDHLASVEPFVDRWNALNRSAGLYELTGLDETRPEPGAVLREILNDVAGPDASWVSPHGDPPAPFLREAVLEKMSRALAESEDAPGGRAARIAEIMTAGG